MNFKYIFMLTMLGLSSACARRLSAPVVNNINQSQNGRSSQLDQLVNDFTASSHKQLWLASDITEAQAIQGVSSALSALQNSTVSGDLNAIVISSDMGSANFTIEQSDRANGNEIWIPYSASVDDMAAAMAKK